MKLKIKECLLCGRSINTKIDNYDVFSDDSFGIICEECSCKRNSIEFLDEYIAKLKEIKHITTSEGSSLSCGHYLLIFDVAMRGIIEFPIYRKNIQEFNVGEKYSIQIRKIK